MGRCAIGKRRRSGLRTPSSLVDRATKCLATASLGAFSDLSSQSRAELALVMVSCVVKVFEATMKSVVSADVEKVVSDPSVEARVEQSCVMKTLHI